jgi:hypothetical protein
LKCEGLARRVSRLRDGAWLPAGCGALRAGRERERAERECHADGNLPATEPERC